MVQNDDNQTPNMAQDADDMLQDNRQSPPTPTPRPPPLTPLPPTPPRFRNRPECTDVLMLRERSLLCVSYFPEGQDSNPMSHFLDVVTKLFDYALRDLEDSDMVGIITSNEVELKDRAIGISFR